jgi:dCMP deaminase
MTTDNRVNFIPVSTPISWDEYFILQAMMAGFRSKDPSTKVGAVFVDQHNHQISMGYNGFVAGIDETELPWGKDKSVDLEFQKYGYVVHAEANAILHANKNLEGSRCYVTLFPCNECAKMIASKKVSEVVYLSDKQQDRDHNRMAKKIFDLAGVKYRQISLPKERLAQLMEHLQTQLNEL